MNCDAVHGTIFGCKLWRKNVQGYAMSHSLALRVSWESEGRDNALGRADAIRKPTIRLRTTRHDVTALEQEHYDR